jgi:hypothetical protein
MTVRDFCDNARIPLTPSPSPARGEGGRVSVLERRLSNKPERANLLPSPLAGEGSGVRGPAVNAGNRAA